MKSPEHKDGYRYDILWFDVIKDRTTHNNSVLSGRA